MNVQDRSNAFDLNKYGVGQPVRRTEDPVLVQGQGRYTDDVNLPRQAYAVFVRSRNGHGKIKNIDTSAAKGMPGVLGVYTGHDLTAYGTMKCAVPFKNRDGSEMKKPARHSLHTDKVRFVGDPVAVVVAETLAQAKDAAEAVEVGIDPLPAVTSASEAAKPGAPQLYDDVPEQCCARLSLWRSREGRGGVLQGRARRQAQPGQQPRRRQRDGAALGDRLDRREGPHRARHRLPGRVRHEGAARRHPRHHA